MRPASPSASESITGPVPGLPVQFRPAHATITSRTPGGERNSLEQSEGISTKVPITVTLVHGTWGGHKRRWFGRKAKPTWYDDGQSFRYWLGLRLSAAGFEPTFRAFEWSGRNSISARCTAAQKLSASLASQFRDTPDDGVIIAHSHGGNVALKAIDTLRVDNKVELGKIPNSNRLRVITLATPFLRVVDNPSRYYFTAISVMCVPIIFYLANILRRWDPMAAIDALRGPNWLAALFVLLFSSAMAGIIIYLVATILQFAWFSITGPDRVGDRKGRTKLYSELTNYEIAHDLRLLIIRGVSDEASLTLALGSIASRISHYVDGWIGQRVLGLTLGVMIGFLIQKFASGNWSAYHDIMGLPQPLSDRIEIFFYYCAGLMIGLRFLMMCMRLVFGRELFFAPHRCEIDTSAVPDAFGNVTVATLPPWPAGKIELNHSIYEHHMCVDVIARWLHNDRMKTAVSLSEAGDMLAAEGNLAEALKSYEASLAIMERLNKNNPNLDWWYALCILYAKLVTVYRKTQQATKARATAAAGRAIISARHAKFFQEWSSWFDQQIAELRTLE
jgi:hypothetical protein